MAEVRSSIARDDASRAGRPEGTRLAHASVLKGTLDEPTDLRGIELTVVEDVDFDWRGEVTPLPRLPFARTRRAAGELTLAYHTARRTSYW